MRLCAAPPAHRYNRQLNKQLTLENGEKKNERKEKNAFRFCLNTFLLLLLFRFDSRIIMIRCVYRIYRCLREKIRRAHAGIKFFIWNKAIALHMNWGRYLFLGQRKRRINAIARTMAQNTNTLAPRTQHIYICLTWESNYYQTIEQ